MIGKIFLVCTLVGSVLLAGVSIVAYFAVPNMNPAMADLENYSFKQQIGETTTWQVKRRLDNDSNVVQNVNQFDAVVRARSDETSTLNKQLAEMGEQQQRVNEERTRLKAEYTQDLQALQQSIVDKQAQVVSDDRVVKEASADFQDKAVRSRETRVKSASLRQDVIRVRAELDELRTEEYVLVTQRRNLVEQLLRIRLDSDVIQDRIDQLQQQLQIP